MKKSILLVCCALMISVVYFGCKRTDESMMPSEAVVEEEIGPDLDTFFNSMAVATDEEVSPDHIVLPDGQTIKDFSDKYFPDLFAQHKGGNFVTLGSALEKAIADKGPQFAKNALITILYSEAFRLSRNSIKLDNGQTKYAYVASDNEEGATKTGKSDCPELYGLDCSGYLKRIFEKSNIYLQRHSSVQADPKELKTALDKKFGIKSAKINVTPIEIEKGNAVTARKLIQSGDIIGYYEPKYKKDKKRNYLLDNNGEKIFDHWEITHVGLAYIDDKGMLSLFQSNGAPTQSCDEIKRKGPTHLKDVAKQDVWLKMKLRILRYTIDISGTWDLSGKCVGTSEDKLHLSLEFTQTQSSENVYDIHGEGDCIDYDGTTPFHMVLDGTYSSLASSFENCKMQFKFSTHTRTDNLPTIHLSGLDETDYIPATCTANCGCDLGIKFKYRFE